MTCPQPRPTPTTMSRAELLKRLSIGITLGILASAGIYAFAPVSHPESLLRTHLVFLLLASLGGIVLVFSTPQQRSRVRSWASASFAVLTTEQKLYLNVVFLFAFAAMMAQAVGVREFLFLVLAFIAYVAVWDCVRLYRLLSETLLGKAAIAIGFAVASTIAYGLASQQVARVVHVTPTGLTHTNLIVAILMIPLLITMWGALMAAAGTAMSSLVVLPTMFPQLDQVRKWMFAGTWPQSTLRFALVTRLFQTVFYTAIGFGLMDLGRHTSGPYEQLIERQIPRLVYEFDMYSGSECVLAPNAKLAPLGDARFLVAHKSADGKIVFDQPVKCDS